MLARVLPAVLLSLLFLVPPLDADATWRWLRGAAVQEFTDADWDLLKAEARHVLDDVETGVRVDWRNDATGNSGAIKAILDFDHGGRACRRLAFLNLSAKGERGVSNYNLCRQADGAWEYLSDSEVR
ncbi:MAG TPA: RT0821/Lpp0805 family surface protein [Pseudomonadales bacterium]|nr:RT0821/Lpp0805 family surface protein [Pseudomonadales bacterium]